MSPRKWKVSRRKFLIGLGVAGGGLALGFYLGKPAMQLAIAEGAENALESQAKLPKTPDAWFEILPENKIRLYLTKAEMGQGIHTSVAQLAAEELDLQVRDLDLAHGTTQVGPKDSFGTGGSASILTSFKPVREAAATFKVMLLTAASKALGVDTSKLEMSPQGVKVKGTDQFASFTDLGAKEDTWEVPKGNIPLKNPRDFKVIGKPVERIDLPKKVTGEAIYGYDARLEGMLYGAVLRPPTLEAKLKSADTSEASRMPGVEKVFTDLDKGFVGVVARTRPQARNAVKAVKAQWDEGKLWQQDEILKMIVPEGKGGVSFQKEGNVDNAFKSGKVIQAEYRSPFAVQAALEPQAALADVKKDSVKVWMSTQFPFQVSSAVAKTLGVKEDIVEVTPTYLGGGFGSKTHTKVAEEAAILSRAVGKPVHVGWDRAEEMTQGYIRPPTHNKLSAVLDDGKIVAMEHRVGSGVVAFSTLPSFLGAIMGADFGSYSGGKIRYNIPNVHGISYNPVLPVKTGWWRGLGLYANTFAVESFLDELAFEAQTDPLKFRLDHLPATEWGARMRKLLNAVAKASQWGKPRAAGRALGLACGTLSETLVAQIAEVSLQDGQVKVHKIWCAMDPGLVVNPDGASAQIQGNIIWGLSSTLKEEVSVKDGKLTADNFGAYAILGAKEAPEVQVILLEDGSQKPRGVGEPPIAPVGAAVGNALFKLTGKRLREVPFTAERLKQAGITV